MRTPKPYFVLLSVLTGFFLGLIYTMWLVPEESVLSGPGNIFINVLTGAAICFGLSLLIKDRLSHNQLNALNVLLFILNLIPITWLVCSIFMLDPNPKSNIEDNPNPERMVDPTSQYLPFYLPGNSQSKELIHELDHPSVRILESGKIELKSKKDDSIDSTERPALP